MNKKVILSILVVVFVLFLGGFAWYQSTLNNAIEERENADTREVTTQISSGDIDGAIVLARGEFVELDPAHRGSGEVSIRDNGGEVLVVLEDDFEVSSGPDLYVWLVSEQDLGGSIGGVDTDPDTFLELGPLNNFSGQQVFEVTPEEYAKHDYAVVIWCRAFGVHFTNAALN